MNKPDRYLLSVAKFAVLEVETTFGIVIIELAIENLAQGLYIPNLLEIRLYDKSKLPQSMSNSALEIASVEEANLKLMTTGMFGAPQILTGDTFH